MLKLVILAAGSWPMWGNGPTHLSVQPLPGRIDTVPQVKWTFSAGRLFGHQFAAIEDVDGDGVNEVVLGCFNGYLYVFDGPTGSVKWSYPTAGWVYSSPAVTDLDGDGAPEIVFGSDEGYIYCLNDDGTLLWRYYTGQWNRGSPTVADVDGDGQLEVLIGSFDQNLYCFTGATGQVEWSFTTGDFVGSTPAAADVDGDGDTEVLFGSDDGYLYCVEGSDGSANWSFYTGYYVHSSPALADFDGDGHLEAVFGSYGYVYCVDAATGTQEWRYWTGGYADGSAAIADVDGDGQLEAVIGSLSDYVYCFDGATGNLEWSTKVNLGVAKPVSMCDIDGDGKLEVLAPDHYGDTLFCLNAEDGSVRWFIPLDTLVQPPIVGDIDGDGCSEVITSGDTVLFALDDPHGATNCEELGSGEAPGKGMPSLEVRGLRALLRLPHPARVQLRLFDPSGRLLGVLADGLVPSGEFSFELRGPGRLGVLSLWVDGQPRANLPVLLGR